jgi:HAD superfamily hydrolase (TIGR01509 family)
MKNADRMKIQAVFFDYDGVLTTDPTGSATTNTYISVETGIDETVISKVFRPYNNDLILGKITHHHIWNEICQQLGTDLNIAILERAFRSTPLNEPMLMLARQLMKSYHVGIITDNKKDRMNYLRRYQHLDSMFNPIVVSSEIRYNKTHPEIFAYALNTLRINPEASVFIDNQEKNLETPRSMGINTIFFDHEENNIHAIEHILRYDMKMEF